MASGLYYKHIITYVPHLKTYSNVVQFTSHYIHIYLKYLHMDVNVLKMQVMQQCVSWPNLNCLKIKLYEIQLRPRKNEINRKIVSLRFSE